MGMKHLSNETLQQQQKKMSSANNDLIITDQRVYNIPAVRICFTVRTLRCTQNYRFQYKAVSSVRLRVTAKQIMVYVPLDQK